MRRLPYHDIPLVLGVNTNFDPETQSLKTLRSCVNMDSYKKFRALGKVPGSTKITSGGAMPAAVKSIHQYEYTALNGTRTRKQLPASNETNLRIITHLYTLLFLFHTGYKAMTAKAGLK